MTGHKAYQVGQLPKKTVAISLNGLGRGCRDTSPQVFPGAKINIKTSTQQKQKHMKCKTYMSEMAISRNFSSIYQGSPLTLV